MQKEKEKKGGHRVMVIDDDAFLLDMYALKFSQKGFEVEAASGTMPAIDKLKEGYTPDIIVVDLVMPVMDGFEFIEEIKKQGLAKDATIIILSNLGEDEDIKRGLSLGAAGYIIKASATPSEVVEKVSESIDGIHKHK
jgi:DNA-binding response OmpR family regulator